MSASQAELLASLNEAQRAAILADFSDAEMSLLEHDWLFWARPAQLMPPGDWLTWLILAGRGFGKTRTGSETIRALVCGDTPLAAGRHSRVALVAETAADARDVMVEGSSGLLSVHPKDFKPLYEPSKRRLTWPNGAIATLYNGTEPDQLRGPQHDLAWVDELAKFQYVGETWDQLQFGLRLGNPRQIVTTTPRPIPIVRQLIKSPTTFLTKGSTFDNRSNLAPKFFAEIVGKYEGTRLGRQELSAEILDDFQNALWTRAMIDEALKKPATVPTMQRVVVAIDPSGTKGQSDTGDDIGIVVAGKGVDGRAYVMADRTCKLSPDGWARRSVAAYKEFSADRIIGERNFGGAMVEHTVRTVDRTVSYKEVTASRGKVVRAEPIAALYEQKRVTHLHPFPELEDQQCAMTSEGYEGEGSPDRVDALVWALTELMITPQAATAKKEFVPHFGR